MFGRAIKEKIQSVAVRAGSDHAKIRTLLLEDFFDAPVSSQDIVRRIRERFGTKWATARVQVYMKKFLVAGIVHGIKPSGSHQNFWVLGCVPRHRALQLIGKSRRVREIEEDLFSDDLHKRLMPILKAELGELRDNFGRNGDCTAFLLRRILEKLIIIVFGKARRDAGLEDKSRPGGWKGLRDMIEIAAREKVNGMPFMTPKTANEIKGIKFLGDTAAHNPLVNVHSETILPQMPFIITAYEELAKRL